MTVLLFMLSWSPIVVIAWIAFGKERNSRPGVRRRVQVELPAAHRAAELAAWNAGEFGRTRFIPFAEGECYIIGPGDSEWVQGLMDIDDRLRRWNQQKPRKLARSRRRD